ncbi:family 43 glycosylhydrolase [Leeuwenhoekiella parthenopeia]|uniref:Family 43 glycosylhydrolase n=1 Tax=Leeuwenhoekiella parthenopeia TaxID=2890320 RepID=A0ABS8GP17_9FLAO|nr:family 43 glycosylhydrolase [Leeuwenhoekiella parthenopeia]MCC4211258.1 family 43 glycosylhydrolase [Leeuwenhoekiella parthenopeia]
MLASIPNFAQEKNVLSWHNPIREGLPKYGMKDFYIMVEDSTYFLLGTSYKDPYRFNNKALRLYESNNFQEWTVSSILLDLERLDSSSWYKHVISAPEIHRIRNRYYLTFNGRNDSINPYGKLGFGIAVADKLKGPYRVLNTSKPLVETNHAGLVTDPDNQTFLYYDMDGRIYMAPINLETAALVEDPKEILGPINLKENYKYLDAPNITKVGETYHLLVSQFFGGYRVLVNHLTANHPMGPWVWEQSNPIYEWLESEADLKVKNRYPEANGYAPPTQVIFSNTLFEGISGGFFIAYHSSEKYSEPYLCIEPVIVEEHKIEPLNPKAINQMIIIP